MIRYAEALNRLVAEAKPLAMEVVGLANADGRRLAKPVIAARDAPIVAVSAMDGFAVRDSDLDAGARSLPIVGAAYAGRGLRDALPAGACARVFTGAPVPQGADRVVLQEDVVVDDGRARLPESIAAKRHIRPAGCDFQAGQTLLAAGLRLNAQRLVAAAAADFSEVTVWRRPRVALLATGDELADPGKAGADCDKISESVTFGVAALITAFGGEVVSRHCAPDHLPTLQAMAADLADSADLVIVIGGASVGERDYARTIFAGENFRMIFAGVAIRPGKPVWAGRAGDRWIFGLPGNPTSALVTARILLAPLITALAGGAACEALDWRSAPSVRALDAGGPRESFVRARRAGEGVESLADQDSASQWALANADTLIRRPAHSPQVEAGALVECLSF